MSTLTIRERVWHRFYCLWYDHRDTHPKFSAWCVSGSDCINFTRVR